MNANAPGSPRRLGSGLPWYFAWVAIGVGLALGISALGIFTVLPALLAAVLLIASHHAGRSVLGTLVGVGLSSLYVAYVQRKGPGTVFWHTATASGSDQYLDPRPWLAAGILLILIGVLAYAWRRRGSS